MSAPVFLCHTMHEFCNRTGNYKSSFVMLHRQRFIFVLIFSLLPLCSLFAQALSFTDVLKVYALDSSAARKFCIDKKWNLTQSKNDGSATRYKYETGDSSQTRLEISYPNDSTSLNTQLNFWFTNTKEYNRLKKDIKKGGFAKKETKQIEGSLSSYAERYVKKNLQIELIRPGENQPYWLFLHPVGNYIW